MLHVYLAGAVRGANGAWRDEIPQIAGVCFMHPGAKLPGPREELRNDIYGPADRVAVRKCDILLANCDRIEGGLGTATEMCLQQDRVGGVGGGVETVFVDDHDLMVEPLLPGLHRDVLANPLGELRPAQQQAHLERHFPLGRFLIDAGQLLPELGALDDVGSHDGLPFMLSRIA